MVEVLQPQHSNPHTPRSNWSSFHERVHWLAYEPSHQSHSWQWNWGMSIRCGGGYRRWTRIGGNLGASHTNQLQESYLQLPNYRPRDLLSRTSLEGVSYWGAHSWGEGGSQVRRNYIFLQLYHSKIIPIVIASLNEGMDCISIRLNRSHCHSTMLIC